MTYLFPIKFPKEFSCDGQKLSTPLRGTNSTQTLIYFMHKKLQETTKHVLTWKSFTFK